jgi:hypothetical protein
VKILRSNIHFLLALHLMLLLSFLSKTSSAQSSIYDTLKMQAIIYQGDTIPMSILANVYIKAILTEEQKKAIAKYNRLRNAVYVTYPYARKAGMLMNEMNMDLRKIIEKKDKKKYIHSREKELRKEFTTPLTNLSVYQGKVLMKLINRETGNNCYEIIKEYRGGLTAGLYETVAFFFSTSLKQPYNPRQDDVLIERFVNEVKRLYGYTEIAKNPSL